MKSAEIGHLQSVVKERRALVLRNHENDGCVLREGGMDDGCSSFTHIMRQDCKVSSRGSIRVHTVYVYV